MAVRNQLIHCDLCGEEYAATYRRCPFCNGRGDTEWDGFDGRADEQDELGATGRISRRGSGSGRHLADNTRGGGYGGRNLVKSVLFLLSLALIVAAAWIILFVIVPKLLPASPAVSSSPVNTVTGSSPVQTISPNPSSPPTSPEADPGTTETTPAPSTPVDTVTPPPASAAALKLSSTDFTLDNKYPTNVMTATGGTGKVTWSISNTEIATISSTGLVTAKKPGTATITATDEAGAKATCIVRVSNTFQASGTSNTPSPSSSQSGTSSAKLSHSDVTLSEAYGMSFTLKVTGGDGNVTFSSSNTAVATVSAGGAVRGVAAGTCVISATLSDGTVLKCTVRVD